MSIGTPGYSLIVCLVSLAAGLLGAMFGMAAGIFILAGLLHYGALVASGWITVGMVMGMLGGVPSGLQAGLAGRCLAIGIVLLIALPVLRGAVTTVVFLFEGDHHFAAISGAVLGIIALGFLLGTGGAH
jgi:uncharacterized membrane protein